MESGWDAYLRKRSFTISEKQRKKELAWKSHYRVTKSLTLVTWVLVGKRLGVMKDMIRLIGRYIARAFTVPYSPTPHAVPTQRWGYNFLPPSGGGGGGFFGHSLYPMETQRHHPRRDKDGDKQYKVAQQRHQKSQFNQRKK